MVLTDRLKLTSLPKEHSEDGNARSTPNVLRAEWYDLPADCSQDFITWLHDIYLPQLITQQGVIWTGHYRIKEKTDLTPVSGGLRRIETDDPDVPKGSQYLLVTAGETSDLFLGLDTPVVAQENVAAERLAVRQGYRQAIFIEEMRVDGLDANGDWTVSAPPAIQLGNFNVKNPDDEFELARFYRLVRLPEVAMTLGSIGARKLVSLAGWPKHGILYAFSSIDPGEQVFEARMLANRKPSPVKLRPVLEYVVHAPNAPHAGSRIWP